MARKAAYDRDEILRKARDLFWEKGFRNTSLKDLESTLDLRPGSIYAGFGSKQALFAAALESYSTEGSIILAGTFAKHSSPLEGLAAHVRGFSGLCEARAPSRACMLAKTILEMPDDDPVLRPLAERLMAEVEHAFEAQFRAARDLGEIPRTSDPARLARHVQAGIIGLRAYAQRPVPAAVVRELAEDLAAGIEALRTE